MRRAFTLVELLCVIAIVGLLVALMLPAVQSAREAARATHCANNLKQIGLAVIQYESMHRKYPTAISQLATNSGTYYYDAPWPVAILPQMQETTLYNAWARAFSYVNDDTPLKLNVASNDALQGILNTPVASYFCPSRRSPGGYYGIIEDLTQNPACGLVAKIDYGMNAGVFNLFQGPASTKTNNNDRPGIGGYLDQNNKLKTIRAKDVTDGLSNTYLVGEEALLARYVEATTANTDSYTDFLFSCFQCGASTCARSADNPPMHDPSNTDWYQAQSQGLINLTTLNAPWILAVPFGSAHLSTWNMVFCDGSVRRMSYNISLATHQAFATRAGGDLPDAKLF